MKAPIEPASADLKVWAAGVLKVDPNASAASVRAAFLRQLERDNFVPASGAEAALAILSGERSAFPEEATSALEERLGQEVDEFADQFFRLHPSARRDRWQELSRRCRWSPRLRTRLEHLKPGLGANPDDIAHADPKMARLAQTLGELFTLRGTAKANRRREALGELRMIGIRRVDRAWQDAAARLGNTYPALDLLDRDFITSMADQANLEKQAKRARAAKPANVAGEKKGNPWALLLILAGGLVSAFLRCDLNQDRRSPAPTFHQIPDIPNVPDFKNPGKWEFDPKTKKFIRFTPKFEDQKQKKMPGPLDPPPPKFDDTSRPKP